MKKTVGFHHQNQLNTYKVKVEALFYNASACFLFGYP